MKRIDTLLRSKLFWHESEVQPAEFAAIMNAVGVQKKSRKVWPFLLSGIMLLCSGIGMGMWMQKSRPVLSEKSISVSVAETFRKQSRVKAPLLPVVTSKPADQRILNALDQTVVKRSHKPLAQDYSATVRALAEFTGMPVSDNMPETILLSKMHAHMPKPTGYAFADIKPIEWMLSGKVPNGLKTGKAGRILETIQPVASFWTAPVVSSEINKELNPGSGMQHKSYAALKAASVKPLFALSAGFNLQFRILPVFSVATGISYYTFGESYLYNYKINDIPVIDSASSRIKGYIHKPDSLARQVDSKGQLRRTFMEIPLRFHLNIYKAKSLAIALEPALTLQFLMHSSGETINRQTLLPTQESNIRAGGASMQLGIPFSLTLKGPLGMCITPFAGRSIGNMSLTETEHKVLLYGGLRVALNYKLYETNK